MTPIRDLLIGYGVDSGEGRGLFIGGLGKYCDYGGHGGKRG